MHQHANAWPDNIKVDPTELRWGSVLDLKKCRLVSKCEGLRIDSCSWIAVTVNFGGLTLAVGYW